MTKGATMTVATGPASTLAQALDQTRSGWLTWTRFGTVLTATIDGWTRIQVTRSPGTWTIRISDGATTWDLTPSTAGQHTAIAAALVNAIP